VRLEPNRQAQVRSDYLAAATMNIGGFCRVDH